MMLDRKMLATATRQFLKYVNMDDKTYDRLPKSQYRSVYGFTADDAVNLNSPDCILPMLIKEYEETSYYCAADDGFLMHIYVFDDLEMSKWQYAIHITLTKIRNEYAQKIYEPNRYIDRFRLVRKPDAELKPHYEMGFHYRFKDGWYCIAERMKNTEYDFALNAEMDLFRKDIIADMKRYMTTGRFVSANLQGVQIGRKGHCRSYVDKRFGLYQIDIQADKPFEFCVTVYRKP